MYAFLFVLYIFFFVIVYEYTISKKNITRKELIMENIFIWLLCIILYIIFVVKFSKKNDKEQKEEIKTNNSLISKSELSFEEKLNIVNESYILKLERNEHYKEFIDKIKNNNNKQPIFHGGCLSCHATEWNTEAICFDCKFFQYAIKYNEKLIELYHYENKIDYSRLYPSKSLATRKSKINTKDLFYEITRNK